MIECKHEPIDDGVENECGGCGMLQYMGQGTPGTAIGLYCSVGMGACFATGTIACRSRGSNDLICTAMGASPTTELCNGIDDNCNGIPDDDANADADCGAGMRCVSGASQRECEPIP
jgi:hypothetical protein